MRPAPSPARGSAPAFPPGAGIGLKPAHYRAVLDCAAPGLWAEAHPENYMVAGGPRLTWLEAVRRRHPLSLHGTGLNLGGAARPDRDHLRRLRALIDRYEPVLVSEHLAWCAHEGVYFNDLLPVIYTKAALDRFCDHVDETQAVLGRKILIENPSIYLKLDAEMPEADFLAETVRRTGCGLLLDVNNVHVSAHNLGHDARAYIDALPADAVGEIHLAGSEADPVLGEALLIDTHGAPVRDAVWALYEHALSRLGPRPTLIERDNNLPDFAVLMAERDRAQAMLDAAGAREAAHV